MNRCEILERAQQCVCHDRNEQYGEPENSFAVIAELWEAYVSAISGQEVYLNAKDVAAMMILFKVARVATGAGKDDNWVDIAGYAACGGEA